MGRLPRRLDAMDQDLERGREIAYAIASQVLGREPGPMITARSMSHFVYLGAEVAVKLVDADGHDRLNREIELAPHLPAGLGAPLLGSGRTDGVRYAVFSRVRGKGLSPGLPGVDGETVRRWAAQAAVKLTELHEWDPAGVMADYPAHEGFSGRARFLADVDQLALSGETAGYLREIGGRAPERPRTDVPVHADCDWFNWLADGPDITALLDFERARFGDPADDWVLLAVTSGPHLGVVVDAIAAASGVPGEQVRAACELRDAALIVGDLRESPTPQRWNDLEGLPHRWW